MSRPTRFYSDRQEKAVAKKLKGRQTANSGATAFSKGDVVTDLFLLEAKTSMTDKKSFSIKQEWLDKNKEEAFAMHKDYSALVFSFGPNSENYYVINETLFKRLNDFLEAENEERTY